MSLKAKKAAWDRHWRAGHLSSLSSANQSSEAPEAKAAWEAFFGRIKSGAVILDVATGNGLVPSLANQHAKANDKAFELIAIDAADIDPETTVKENPDSLKGVLFIAEVEAEDLPFEDNLFDAVTSQYGLEYSEMEKSIAEVARVLKPGGLIRFVLHAGEGEIVRFNAPKAKQCRYLLSESGVFEALDRAIKATFEDGEVEETKQALLEALEGARKHLQGPEKSPELALFLEVLNETYRTRAKFRTYENFKSWLSEIREEVEGQVVMIEAMADAALSEEEAGAFVEKLNLAGFSNFNLAKLTAGPGALIGYVIEAVKA